MCRSFLVPVESILQKSKGKTGLHLVHVKLAPHNCRRVHNPSPNVRKWFDNVEQNLIIYQLNDRGRLRKNGVAVLKGTFAAYDNDYRVGMITNVLVGCRITAPFAAGCAVCTVETLHPSRLTLVETQAGSHSNMLLVDKLGEDSTPELVSCTLLRYRYVQALWDPAPDDAYALVRYEEY